MNEVDFLPECIRQQRARHKQIVRQSYLLVACVLAMGLLAYVRQGRVAVARAEVSTLTERAQNLKRQIAMIPPLERQMAHLMIKKQINEELGSRTDCTAVLAELCRLMPGNMALLSMELKTVDVRVQAVRPAKQSSRTAAAAAPGRSSKPADEIIRRVRLDLTGVAPTDVDVANFIGQLSASCLFEQVQMGYSKTKAFRGRSSREFQASCYLAK